MLGGLPAEVTPDNTADIQRIIDAVSERIDRPIRGWKTYTVYKPMNPPFSAPIYDLFPSGAEIPAEISPHRLIEPEIMFRVDRDLPARDGNYDISEVMESVTAVVGFEVIGSRFRGRRRRAVGRSGIVVRLALRPHRERLHRRRRRDPRLADVAFEDVHLRMTEGDRELISVVGCHPFDNPFLPVVVSVNRLRRHRGVKAGDVIVTNSSTSFFAVDAGIVDPGTYEGLGEVTATFARS